MGTGKVAVITGGTGGLGQAIVPVLIDRGYSLAITYIVPEEATALEEKFDLDDDRLLLRRVDSTDSGAVDAFFSETRERLGRIEVMCALVGGWAAGRDVAETDDVRFDRMIDLNLRSAFYAVRAVIPYLRESGWGRIVLVGSRAAFDNPAGQAAFNIAKAGVISLAKSVAHELDDTEINANAILPNLIDTPATRSALPYADYMDWPKPEEIAAVIDFLCSPASDVVNGAAIPAYGKS